MNPSHPFGLAPLGLANGVELLGPYQGTGTVDLPYLVRRGDGSMIQVSLLLFTLLEQLQRIRPGQTLAASMTEATGRTVSDDNVRYLVENKLAPLGLVSGLTAPLATKQSRQPVATLIKGRRVLPPRAVEFLARATEPLFHPYVVVALLIDCVIVDAALLRSPYFLLGLLQITQRLDVYLALTALVVLSMAFHELGHAAGLRYSGGRPGPIGVGFYFVWPAFYAEVNDAYRLDRKGRIRTDLGGIYFSIVFILATAVLYALTGLAWLLIALFIQHVQAAIQLLPFLKLDGYFLLSDITGVPDLSRARMRRRKRGAGGRPFRPTYKRWVRAVVFAWTILGLAALVAALYLAVRHGAGYVVGASSVAIDAIELVAHRAGDGDWLGTVAGAIQAGIVLLVPAGIGLMILRFIRVTVANIRRLCQAREHVRHVRLAPALVLWIGACLFVAFRTVTTGF